jgi:hypothetical protein
MMTRRTFLAGGVALAGCGRPSSIETAREFTGGIVGPSASVGHLLRGALPAVPERIEKKRVVIVGGGIAGLSAARRLQQKGCDDFVLLELESRTGGNSSFAESQVSPAPWGAHYVPLPSLECTPIIELFRDLGVITGFDAKGLPIYNEFYLCAEPMERLFIHGRWQEGLFPNIGVTAEDRRQFADFIAAMNGYADLKGVDGKRAFEIPIDQSSSDSSLRALDSKPFAEFLEKRGWNSRPLRWYIDYCCRDDYGARAANVSAWAGIHYFACRNGAASNASEHAVVTWPEGNGWLVKQLDRGLGDKVVPNSLAYRVTQSVNSAFVDVLDSKTRATRRYEAESVIFCAPRFVAHRVVEELQQITCPVSDYAPWMVANITVKTRPTGFGAEPAWDNVLYESESLGYVVATHQNPSRAQIKTVLTYYLPLCAGHVSPREARELAAKRTYSDWCDLILADLEKVHPKITAEIENLDVCVWGHGMVTPVPGFIWGGARRAMQQPLGRIHFAHSDMSGISIFEEAHLRGLDAADTALTQTG